MRHHNCKKLPIAALFSFCFGCNDLFFVVLAGGSEEIGQVYEISAVGIFGKTDGADERFIAKLAVVKGGVDSAKVDKIERGASEQKFDLEIFDLIDARHIVQATALAVDRKLAYADDLAVDFCAVSHKCGVVFDAATRAERLLFGF